MPRARPGARKTTARRRIQRYRSKWTHHVLPVIFKELLPHMTDEYEETEPPFVECEEPTMDELETKGVPEAEWPYYLGFMKRMLALYRAYTGETLMLEKINLIEEYVLRGKDRDVLDQVQEVAAECAGVPYVPPPEFCPSGEQMVNGGFETGLFPPWQYLSSFGDESVQSDEVHSGTYALLIPTIASIFQDLETPIPVACIESFKMWYKKETNARGDVRVEYMDGSDSTVVPFNIDDTWTEIDILDACELDITKTVKRIWVVKGYVVIFDNDFWLDDVSLVGSGAELP